VKCADCNIADEIFSYEVNRALPNGPWLHFNATAILLACVSGLIPFEVVTAPLTEEGVSHIEKHHGIEQDHVDKADPSLPILIVAFDDGEVYPDDLDLNVTIDGNHRIVKAWRIGLREVQAILVSYKHAKPFLLEDVPQELETWTQEFVRSSQPKT
jgi:hypothetical protein